MFMVMWLWWCVYGVYGDVFLVMCVDKVLMVLIVNVQ